MKLNSSRLLYLRKGTPCPLANQMVCLWKIGMTLTQPSKYSLEIYLWMVKPWFPTKSLIKSIHWVALSSQISPLTFEWLKPTKNIWLSWLTPNIWWTSDFFMVKTQNLDGKTLQFITSRRQCGRWSRTPCLTGSRGCSGGTFFMEKSDFDHEKWWKHGGSTSKHLVSMIVIYPLVNKHSYWKWAIYSGFSH